MEEETKKEEEVSEVEEKPVEQPVEEVPKEETKEEPKAEQRSGFEREMHKAVCADCGKDCEVPFKPIEGRKIYCRDCYRKHKPRRF